MKNFSEKSIQETVYGHTETETYSVTLYPQFKPKANINTNKH